MERPQRLIVLPVFVVLSACTMIGSPELERSALPPRPGYGPMTDSDEIEESSRSAEPASRGGNMDVYEQNGGTYRVLSTSYGYDERGIASWYGKPFHGRRTSNGETFDMNELSAAHRTLPLPSWVEVTNLANGRTLVVRVNDRGPFHDPDRRIIDLSRAAAQRLGILQTGTAPVRVRAVEPYQYRTP